MEFLSELHAWYVDEYGPEPEPPIEQSPDRVAPAPGSAPAPLPPRARNALLYSRRAGDSLAVHLSTPVRGR